MSDNKTKDVLYCDEKELLEIMEDSVRATFQSFLGFKPEVVQSVRDRKETLGEKSDAPTISGSVAFLQKNFEGTLSISFNRESAIQLFKVIYQEEINSVDDARVVEGIAELANIIHGMVKENLNLRGYDYKMCLPVVIIGKNHAIFHDKNSPGLSVLFKTQFGKFSVEVLSHDSSVKDAA